MTTDIVLSATPAFPFTVQRYPPSASRGAFGMVRTRPLSVIVVPGTNARPSVLLQAYTSGRLINVQIIHCILCISHIQRRERDGAVVCSVGLRIERSWVRSSQASPCCVLEQDTYMYLPTVLVKPRKRGLRPDMTGKLLTGT